MCSSNLILIEISLLFLVLLFEFEFVLCVCDFVGDFFNEVFLKGLVEKDCD